MVRGKGLIAKVKMMDQQQGGKGPLAKVRGKGIITKGLPLVRVEERAPTARIRGAIQEEVAAHVFGRMVSLRMRVYQPLPPLVNLLPLLLLHALR